MPVYLVERSLPGITMRQLAAIERAAIESSERFTREGTSVRYLRSVFLPADSRCLCLFEASDERHIREVNDAAQLPYTRIVNAYEVPADLGQLSSELWPTAQS